MGIVKITINGQEHEVEAGRWLIDVLNEAGCDIPHFCYHPGLGPDGNCRMCQVEYVTDRGSRVAISCNQPVTEGMNINTHSEKVLEARAGVEEALLLNHPLDCPICDKAGECTLQNYYMAHDLKDSRQQFTRFKKNKALDIGPTMILDQERCVLCDRCVRFLRDWAGDEQLYIAGRGHGSFLTPFPGKPVDSPYSLNTVDLCPVGALTSKDFRFATPTWFLRRTPSVCTTCARGCAIYVDTDHRDKKVKRLRPRHNPHVNGYWMCDEGRLNYKFVNTDRVTEASVDRRGEKFETSVENALKQLGTLLGAPAGTDEASDESGATRDVTLLASATCTVEEMYMMKRLAAALDSAPLYVARHVSDGTEDEKLRRADRHPNVRGAEVLEIPVIDLREDGQVDTPEGSGTLLAVGFDYGVSSALESFCQAFSDVAVMASRKSALTDMARVCLPGLTFAEKDGLVVNFEGHIQQISPAFDHLWDRIPPWQIMATLLSSLTGESVSGSIKELRAALGKDEAAFAAVDLNAVGPTGLRLEAQTVR